jgi:hypothetical protein
MSTLSSLLVQRQLAPVQAIEAAIARHVLQGGDLATSLLELGVVDESSLVPLLAAIAGLAPAPIGPLKAPDARTLRAVPGELALKYGFFPLELQGRTLKLAVSELLSRVVEEDLSFMLDVELDLRIAPLVRIRQALAENFGIPLDRRFLRLVAKLEGRPDPSPSLMPPSLQGPGPIRLLRPASVPPPSFGTGRLSALRDEAGRTSAISPPLVHKTPVVAAPAEPSPAVSIPVNPVPSLPRADESLPESPRVRSDEAQVEVGRLREMPSERRPSAMRRERLKGPFSYAMAEREIDEAASQREIVEIYFDFAAQFFEYAALFTVRADLAEGRDAHGPGVERERVQRIGVPLDLPSTLATTRTRAAPVVGRFAQEGLDAELLRDLERGLRAGDLNVTRAVIPLLVRERVVALLYGDDGRVDVELSTLGDLVAFTALVGARLERVLLNKKRATIHSTAPARTSSRALAPQPIAEPPSPGNVPSRDAPTDSTEIAISPSAMSERVPELSPGADFSFAMSLPPPAPTTPASAPPSAADDEGIPSVIVRAMESGPLAADGAATQQREEIERAPARKQTLPGMLAFAPPERPADSGTLTPAQAESPDPPRVGSGSQPALRRGLAPEFAARSERMAMGEPLPSTPPPNATSSELDTKAFPLVTSRRRPDATRVDEADVSGGAPPRVDPAPVEAASFASAAPIEPPPSVVVDAAAEYERLVRSFVEGGPANDVAFAELVRHADVVVPMIAPRFPGKLRVDRHRVRDELPAASQCGPYLELFVAGRRVALPFMVAESVSDAVEHRFWATHVLAELRYAEAACALVPRLFDEDAAVRRVARRSAAALVGSGAAGQPILTGLDALAQSTEHSVEQRVLAIEAMGDVRLGAMVPSLVAMLSDASPEVADAAGKALLLITRQDHGPDGARWTAWWAQHGSRHRVEWLIDALVHETPAIRRAAGDELKSVTKEYFGYYDDLPKRERERAQARYREWWKAEGHARFS